ncbi:flippase-like domain-containing protein, partial [bacterium]|nr:flippase-like domain-containing protein [bacterium]
MTETHPGRGVLSTEPATPTNTGSGDASAGAKATGADATGADATGADAPRVERSKVQNASLIFVLGSVAIIGVTLAMTTGEETWRGMAHFGGWALGLLLVLEFLRMSLEGLGLLVLVNGTQDHKITLIEALELTLEGYFIGQLIPVSAAGVPYQAFLLTRKGVRA